MDAQQDSLFASLRTTLVNGGSLIGGKIVLFALSFGFITALANLVPESIVGSYQYLLSVLTIASITTLPGMYSALVRAVSRGNEGTLRRMMHLKLKFGMIGSLIAIAIGIYYLWQGNTVLGSAFLISAPFVPLTDTFSEMAFAFFQGRKRFGTSILLGIMCYAIFFVPALIVMLVTDNLIILAAVFFASQAIAGLVAYATARPTDDLIDESSVRFGFHLTAVGILRTIANNIDRVIVWNLLGPIAAATYTFAATPMTKVEQLVPIDALALPDLSRMPESATTKKLILRKMGLLFILVIPTVIVGIILTPVVFGILFPKFPESIPLFQILLITLVIAPLGMMRTSFTAWSKKKSLYAIETISPIVRIGCMIIGGLWGGLMGLVLGIAASRLFDGIMIAGLFTISSSSKE